MHVIIVVVAHPYIFMENVFTLVSLVFFVVYMLANTMPLCV